MKTEAKFTFDTVRHDQENDVHLVVSLKAPKLDWEKDRPPICVIPVIDCSQSMTGEKIEYAKQSVMKLIDHLQPGDFCGLVGFSTEPRLIFPVAEVTQSKKEEMKTKVGELSPIYWTNFSSGMLMGLEQAAKLDPPPGMIVRLIMFTDGNANQGIATTSLALNELLKENLGEATLSAFGYGTDANQELLADLATVGKGNYAFIRNPDDALGAFAKELGGLLSTYAQDIEVVITAQNGHTITSVISDVDAEEDNKLVKITIPDILSEEQRDLVLAVTLSKQTKALPRDLNICEVKVTYGILKDGKVTRETLKTTAKMRFVKEGNEQTKPTVAVAEMVARAKLAEAQIEAEKHAAKGDWGAAEASFTLTQNFISEGELPPSYTSLVGKSRGRYAQQSTYLSSAGTRSSMTKGLTRSFSSSGAEAAADLGSIGVIVTNAAITQTTASFMDPSDAVVTPDVIVDDEEKSSTSGVSKTRSKRW